MRTINPEEESTEAGGTVVNVRRSLMRIRSIVCALSAYAQASPVKRRSSITFNGQLIGPICSGNGRTGKAYAKTATKRRQQTKTVMGRGSKSWRKSCLDTALKARSESGKNR